MSFRTVLASSTTVWTAAAAAEASGETVTVTGLALADRRLMERPGRRPLTVLVWDCRAKPPAPPTRTSALRPAEATCNTPRDDEAKAFMSTDRAESVPVVDDDSCRRYAAGPVCTADAVTPTPAALMLATMAAS